MDHLRREKEDTREYSRRKNEVAAASITDIKGRVDGMAESIMAYYAGIKSGIEALIEERQEIIFAPRTKEELVKLSHEALDRLKRELILDGVLKPHFEDLLRRKIDPFLDGKSSAMWDSPEMLRKLWFAAISHEDVDAVWNGIDETVVGISEEERAGLLADVDSRILVLEKKLKEPPPKEIVKL